jgi:hypothetical protein
MFASVFLMKAISVGAVSEKEPEILQLQHRIIACFREAAVDEEHIAAEIASLLGRVFPAFPTVPAQVHLDAALETNLADATEPLPPPDADVFANWGFDPVIILSEMDDFIQAIDR